MMLNADKSPMVISWNPKLEEYIMYTEKGVIV